MTLSIENQNKLDAFWAHCVKNQYFNIGYPESADFNYTNLERFLRFSINNCGDWSEYCNYLLNSFDFEKEVIEYFAHTFKIPFDKCWGYVTNGGTEGNMFGCYLARELFPDSTLYYSKDTHYSVAKIVKLLRIKSQVVESLPNGEVNYDDLIKKIEQDGEKHPIIFANIGTTVKGAIDNIFEIQDRIAKLGIAREDYYIHADAALSGMILPFVDEPQGFNFADGIDSIGVSGHKMIGSPIPCGIVIAKKENVDQITVEIDYIAAHDKTITGSRNGHTPLMMWEAVKSHSFDEWQQRINRCLELAEYAVQQFQKAGIDAWRNKNSITVVFPCPSEDIWKKHCLATSNDLAHMVVSAHHLTHESIDDLINDVIADETRKIA
ncbi:histidine decarboxylase [Photobacterium damselae subsp. damselae]|uniref:histidine decarboxylase n=1 Tax=Photobacterium damselae TaxID=38293 RepID=UPI001F360C9A|nr:histidine decarboxylase [Photobacterium damselae]UKA05825.1 histidine decarboxylase [Photobacterium damselae subsp. damselae]UKA20930.1 histidine decarboxylase [Photobacterium damselae subsp. damselae]